MVLEKLMVVADDEVAVESGTRLNGIPWTTHI